MTPQGFHGDPDVVSKSRFAQLANVSPARVSQWIADHKISGEALVGEGRSAQIRVSVACAQLKRTLDINQRLGNGVTTRLDLAAPGAPALASSAIDAAPLPGASGPTAPSQGTDPIEDQLKREKLEQLLRANRRAAREEAEAVGRLTDSDHARREMGRIAAQSVTIFEGALAELAAAVASKFQLPQRDVVHLLRSEFRHVRAAVAKALRRDAEQIPAFTTAELGADETEPALVAANGELAAEAQLM